MIHNYIQIQQLKFAPQEIITIFNLLFGIYLMQSKKRLREESKYIPGLNSNHTGYNDKLLCLITILVLVWKQDEYEVDG